VAATAAGAGYYLYDEQARYSAAPTETVTIPEGWNTVSTYLENHPPVASFRRRPYYLAPTDQQIVHFTNTSYDLDGDQLEASATVDQA
jgi:hypothetical protein